MIRLDSTTKKLQAVLGGAITTNQLQCVVSFFDENPQGEDTSGASKETNTNSTTDVDICSAPAQNFVRNIDTLSVYNRDTVSATVTVKIDDGGTETVLVRRMLPPSATLTYDHESGWNVTGDPLAFGIGILVNGKIVTSIGSNALTIAVKTLDGADPSSASPVYARFPSATLTDSLLSTVAITSALSVVISSGSTLGHASAIAQHIFVYLINNSGTAELAVSNLPPDYPGTFGKARLVSTTAEGGAGAADSATGVYSTTARSNVPWVCVAKMLSTQTTAGTWAANMTQVDLAPFSIPKNAFSVERNSAQSITTTTWTKVQHTVERFDYDGIYDSVTNFRVQPNVAGPFRLEASAVLDTFAAGAGYRALITIRKNNADLAYGMANPYTSGQTAPPPVAITVDCNGTTDYFDVYVYQDTGGSVNLSNSFNVFSGSRVGGEA